MVPPGETAPALKFTQTWDPAWKASDPNHRFHSEVIHRNGYNLGDSRFYGFWFRLQDSWPASPAQSYNLAQFIASFSGLSCDDGHVPSTMIWVEGNQLATRVRNGTICNNSKPITSWKNLATVTPGAWHKIVIQANWQSSASGYFKLWYDGVKKVDTLGTAGAPLTGTTPVETSTTQFEFRVGIYANSWHDDAAGCKGANGACTTDEGFRQVWFDEIGIGTTFADADPEQWT